MPLHDATVSGDIFVYTDTDDSVNSVSFYIDDELIRTERVAPHDLAGTEIGSGSGLDRDARPFDTTDLTDGVRTLRVEVDEGAGMTATATAQFIVANDSTPSNGVIGVWSSASRKKTTVLRDDGDSPHVSGKYVQVSRLGSPVVNEVLMPLDAKNLFNATEPKDDGANIADFIVNPGDTQGGFALVPLLNGLTGCDLDNGRIDLDMIFLTGIHPSIADALAAAVPSLAPFADAGGNFTGGTPGEMLRLNMNVAPSTSPSPLGLLGGDPAGFPNGRRVGDDVVDIALKGAGGAVLHVLGAVDCPASLGLSDNVDGNDVPYMDSFPYLGTPHQGYEHTHSHTP